MKFLLFACFLMALAAPALAQVPAASDPHLAALAGRTCSYSGYSADSNYWWFYFTRSHGIMYIDPRLKYLSSSTTDLGRIALQRQSATSYFFVTPWHIRFVMTPQASPSGLVVQRVWPNGSHDRPVTYPCSG